MPIAPVHIFLSPLGLLVWAMDLFLTFAALRLFFSIPSLRSSRPAQSFREIVDPVTTTVGRWLAYWRRRPTPFWLAWASTLGGLFLLRQLLAWFIVSLS